MKMTATAIQDLLVFDPKVFGDDRGFFLESFNQAEFEASIGGTDTRFVQDNHSRSTGGVLRGLHYQVNKAQGKLVRVIRGAVFDVAVDLRRSSKTYGRWLGMELSESNKRQLWIPEGFAHGFLVLSDVADFLYKTTDYYSPADERAIRWDDPDLGIEWPKTNVGPILSGKDRQAGSFKNAECFD